MNPSKGEHPIDDVQVAVAAGGWICDGRDLGGVDRTIDPVGGLGMSGQEVKARGARRLSQHRCLQIAVRPELAQEGDHSVRVVARPRHVARTELVGFEFLFARKPKRRELRGR
jgi:hypothetical protein